MPILTNRGLSSYLEKIKVPAGFFKRCSPSLKRDILREHHEFNKKQDVLIRFNEDRIRFIGSSKYGIFDDLDIVESLKEVNELHNLSFREAYQSDDSFIMRATTSEPIIAKNGRPFFPGIQIQNSETGLGSISIQFLLWEQICTNGITVPRGILQSYNKKHFGKKDAREELKESCKELIGNLPLFIDSSHKALTSFVELSAKDFEESLEKDTRIPKAVKDVIPSLISNYTPPNMQPTALEVLSAYTDAIKRYTWDTRTQLEDIAGEYMYS
jgi:hypothetical protein